MIYKSLMNCLNIYYVLLLTQFYYAFLGAQFCYQLFLHILLLINKLLFLYSHLQLLVFQIKLLLHFLLTKHSHLHLILFHFCLLLQIIWSNLHSYLQLLCHFICFVLFFHGIRSNTFAVIFLTTFGTHTLAYGLLILLQFPPHLFTLPHLLIIYYDFLLKHILMNLHLIMMLIFSDATLDANIFFITPNILCNIVFFHKISVNILYFIIRNGFIIDAKIINVFI